MPRFSGPIGPLSVLRAAAIAALSLSPLLGGSSANAQSAGGCQLDQIAFCDTFDAPSPNGAGTRSGDLDGVVWGVSRATSDDNPSQGAIYNWNASHLKGCGPAQQVVPPHDVQICSGQLFDSVSDEGAVAVLAMYPRQPFDFAGRTGKVVFDVSNDTEGSHMAWPEIVITDQPVPAPFEAASGLADLARNSFGFSLNATCQNNAFVPSGGDSFGVSTMFTTTNYSLASVKYTSTGCVKKSSGAGGPLNHVELRISPTHVEVWATDAGQSDLKQLATADVTMPLTRGLVWMEEAHYNACKEPGTQCDHTFAWDNFGFDGPILPRDLGFDVPDAQQAGRSSSLGYLIPAGKPLNIQIDKVHDLENASGALLEFTWYPREKDSITFTVNGNAPHTVQWPYGNSSDLYKSQTLAVDVPLAELTNGSNQVQLTSSAKALGGISVGNFDLILVGAGGLPNGAPAPAVQPSPPPPPPAPPADEAPAPDAPQDNSGASE
jgi:hypothetical protein